MCLQPTAKQQAMYKLEQSCTGASTGDDLSGSVADKKVRRGANSQEEVLEDADSTSRFAQNKARGHFQKGRLTLEGTLQRSASGRKLVMIDHRQTPKQEKRRLGHVSWKIPKTKTKMLRGERGNFG